MKKMGFVFAAMIAMVGSATVLADSHKGNSYVHDMAYLTIHVAVSGKEWSNEAIVEYGRQLNKLIAYYNNHEGAYLISQFSHNLNAYAYGMEHHPEQLEVCGAGNGFQVFDVDGRPYPCHILSPLVLKGSKLQRIREGLVGRTESFADPKCVTCPYTSACPTCIACNYLYRNNLHRRDLTHCRIMKTEVRACIKKEVMRLKRKKEFTSEDAKMIDSINKLVEFERMKY